MREDEEREGRRAEKVKREAESSPQLPWPRAESWLPTASVPGKGEGWLGSGEGQPGLQT